MANLLKQTLEILKNNGKSSDDVRWVGVHAEPYKKKDAEGSWDDFAKLANIIYDDGYGGNKIERCLVVVGDDWWLERGEYDGGEWWEFKTLPQRGAPAHDLRDTDLLERP